MRQCRREEDDRGQDERVRHFVAREGFTDAYSHFEGNGVRVHVSLAVTGNVSQRLGVLADLMQKNMIAPRRF